MLLLRSLPAHALCDSLQSDKGCQARLTVAALPSEGENGGFSGFESKQVTDRFNLRQTEGQFI